MAIEAQISKHKKTNLKIYVAVCIIFAFVFAYDGYLSKYEWSRRRSFYKKHTKDGRPDETMIFNQITPIVLAAAAIGLAARLRALKDKKLLVDENGLIISDKEKIAYDSIQKIDKTHFGSKGFFIITYRDNNEREVNRKLNDRTYDNLQAVLDELVAKIT
jgi:hypothetical protein